MPPTIALTGEGSTITLDCGAGVKLNASNPTSFIISLPPVTLSQGFTLKIYDSAGGYMEKSTNASVTLSRAELRPLKAFSYEANGTTIPEAGESGIYLGVIGFNQKLFTYPIGLLTTETKQGYYDFIDGFDNNNDGTAIYYAVDQSISTLQSWSFPEDLNSAYVVTFTDGIDNYSLDHYDEIEFGRYSSPDECGDFVKSRLNSEQVAGNDITAYAIGSKHSDVNSSRFTSTLNRIASSSSNVYELDAMSSVESKFKEIAKSIVEVNQTQNITVSIAGGLANGERVRFTFDLASTSTSPTNSTLYIEGTFQRTSSTTRTIAITSCKGLKMNGTEVVGNKNAETGLFDFTFKDVSTDKKVLIDRTGTLEWWGNPWQKDTEFHPDENTRTEILNHSAAIMLVLDCTYSLGDKFSQMKTCAKSFIATMLPNVVPSQTSLSFGASGSTKTVSITSNCEWTPESSESWLTVSRDGDNLHVSVSVNEGTESRTATISLCQSGSDTVLASISVSQNGRSYNGHDYVDLGLPSGLLWATCNVGASAPEEYGNYYAWGETETKSDYSSSTSIWYGVSYSDLQSQGVIDSNGNLTSSYDAASVIWGGSWRMPTQVEWRELINSCTWTWTSQNGVYGRKVTGPNGNSIFLPAAGYRNGSSLYGAGSYGYYWSSTATDGSNGAYSMYFGSGGFYTGYDDRYYGQSVRPVSE